MSGTFDPSPDAGRDQSAHASVEDRFASVMREAAEDAANFDAAEEQPEQDAETEDFEDAEPADMAEGESEEIETEDASEDHDDDEQAESEDEAVAPLEWDGDPDNVPSELRPYFDSMMDRMNKGVNKKLREIAEARKQVEDLSMRYQQTLLQMQQSQVQQGPQGQPKPPEMPGPDGTDADWKAYETANREYLKHELISDLKTQGLLPDQNQFRVMQQQQEIQRRNGWVFAQPDVNDDIMYKMAELIQGDEAFANAYDSDAGVKQLYVVARERVKAEQLAKENAELKKKAGQSVVAQAKRKAGAAKRSVPRSGGKAAESPEEKFNRKAFRNTDEVLDHFKEEALRELRNK